MNSLFLGAINLFLAWNLIGAEKAAGTGPSFKGPLGLQMYSLRFYSPTNLLGKLDKVHEYGLKTIEGGSPARGMSPQEFFKELDKRGIKLVSSGVDYARLKSNPDAVVEQSKKLGVKYVMCSWIPMPKASSQRKTPAKRSMSSTRRVQNVRRLASPLPIIATATNSNPLATGRCSI